MLKNQTEAPILVDGTAKSLSNSPFYSKELKRQNYLNEGFEYVPGENDQNECFGEWMVCYASILLTL